MDQLSSKQRSRSLVTPHDTTRLFGPADFRHRFPEGRMGSHPEPASVETGWRIIEAVAEDLAKEYRTFLTEE